MKEIDTSKYSKESLEFINKLSEKALEESIVSIRELTSKSYVIIGVYFSIQVFCIERYISDIEKDIFLIICLSFLIPVIIIFKNLLPTKMNFVGSRGDLLIHDYFEQKKENQIKHYLSARIEDLNTSNKLNGEQIVLRNLRIKFSIVLAFVNVVIISLWFWNISA